MEEVNGWDRMDSMFYRPLHPRGYWRSLLWAVTVRAKGVLDYVWSPPAHVVAWWRAVQFAETLVLRVRVIRRYAQRCSVLVSLVIEGLYAHLRVGPAGLAAVFSERVNPFRG